MTEWERAQKGLIYNDFDEDLFNRRVEAKKLFKAYNKLNFVIKFYGSYLRA